MVPAGGPNTFFIEIPFISLPTTRAYSPVNAPTISHCFLLNLPLQQTYLERLTHIKNIYGFTKNKKGIRRAHLYLYVLFMRQLTNGGSKGGHWGKVSSQSAKNNIKNISIEISNRQQTIEDEAVKQIRCVSVLVVFSIR